MTTAASPLAADITTPTTTPTTAILEEQERFSKVPPKVLGYAGALGLFNLGLVGIAAATVASSSTNIVLRRVRRREGGI